MADCAIRATRSSKLRERLPYPVIDTDGHILEAPFVIQDFLKKVGGPSLVERFNKVTPRGAHEPKTVPWAQFSGGRALRLDSGSRCAWPE